MKAIAYVRELPADEWVEYSLQRNIIEQFANMADFSAIIIDKTESMRKTNGNVFYNWQELLDRYPDHKFIFLDVNAIKDIKNYIHLKIDDKIIFCVGSEETGFDGLDMTGKESYKLVTHLPAVREHHAILVAGYIMADRVLREI